MYSNTQIKCEEHAINKQHQGPLLLTWFNFNPIMDK